MTLLSFVNVALAFGVVVSQVFLLAIVVWFFALRKKYPLPFLHQYGLLLAFIVSAISVASSLFYSNVAGFPPCDLCWFQRIFMYPLVIILGTSLIKKNRDIVTYALAVVVPGFLVSLYHNYIYYSKNGLTANCVFGGSQVSCVKRYVFELGYVTIPLMALTAFALVIVFLLFAKYKQSSNYHG